MKISPQLQRVFGKTSLQLQKYSPQILTVAGIAGLVAAGVIAAKQTLKLEPTLETANARMEEARSDEENSSKAVRSAYIHNVIDLGKLYWAPVTLAAGSTVLILVGHNILHKRNVALIGAYKGLEQAFSEYRKRVIEEHGAEADEKYRYGIRDVTDVDPESGKKTKRVEVSENPFVFRFDQSNANWNGSDEANMYFVKRFELIFNDLLTTKGHVFLNEVLDALDIPRTPAGQVLGWVHNKNNGDDYVDFGIKDLQKTNGYILLNFNVDGDILHVFS